MRKIKIAQIGTSSYSHGTDIFETLSRNNEVFEIVGYHFPNNERERFPERMSAYDGYRELTLEEILDNPEIEAVAVETEETYLTKYALMVAERKKHMHMEKPGGLDLADFEKMIDVVKRNNTIFHTGYMYRYNPCITELKEQIKNGELGDIISVEAQMNCIHPEKVRQWLEHFPGGMMFFLGCHLIDLIVSIMGIPNKVTPFNRCSGVGGVTAEDFGMAVLEYDEGLAFAKTSAVEIGGFERRQLVVSGTKKTVEINPLEQFTAQGDLVAGKLDRHRMEWDALTDKVYCDSFNRYDAMMLSFAQMVRGEKENPWGYDYELELYKTILKACGNYRIGE